jgi:DNA segregation ATPase FtsK/SpoIIIE-like protein
MAHQQLLMGAWAEASTRTIVAGGLLYSAKTVWQWGRLTFEDRWKATGFVLLIEGVMMCSPVLWLARTALLYLLTINAIATACLLALRDQSDRRGASSHPDEIDPPAIGRPPSATTKLLTGPLARSRAGRAATTPESDALYDRAIGFVTAAGECSISGVQRKLSIGYNSAAKLVDRMECEGIVGPVARGGGKRQVLVRRAAIELTSPSPLGQLSHAGTGGQ